MSETKKGHADQYANDFLASVWENYIGDIKVRTQRYGEFIINLFKEKKCETILDLACGTGVDSIMLLEAGFKVTSIDLSEKMLNYALQVKEKRIDEPGFNEWTLKQANWLTLFDDIELTASQYDGMICIGNSFAFLLEDHKKGLENFYKLLKPGGILIIDHRNFDQFIDEKSKPEEDIYYRHNEMFKEVKRSVIYEDGKPHRFCTYYEKGDKEEEGNTFSAFTYPHRVNDYTNLLEEVFQTKDKVYGDYKELQEGYVPGFYIHIIEKPL